MYTMDVLKKVWMGIVAADGKLLKWQILGREHIQGRDARLVDLRFEHGRQFANVTILVKSGEIDNLYFRAVIPPPN